MLHPDWASFSCLKRSHVALLLILTMITLFRSLVIQRPDLKYMKYAGEMACRTVKFKN